MTTLPDDTPWTSGKTGPRAPVPVAKGAEYITARQFCDLLGGVSFTSLARYIKADPEFPRPIYFANRIRFFRVADIEAYQRLCELRTAAKALAKSEGANTND